MSEWISVSQLKELADSYSDAANNLSIKAREKHKFLHPHMHYMANSLRLAATIVEEADETYLPPPKD